MKGSLAEAKAFALKLLSYRSRSKKEITERLKMKGFSHSHIQNTVSFLEDAGFLNDDNLVEELVRYSTQRRPLGKKGIESLLIKRGIDRELIKKTISDYTTDLEAESATIFVGKKLKTLQNYPSDIIKQRLWGMLRRRGFSSDIASKVIKSLSK